MINKSRTPIIAGNWKMYKTIIEAIELVDAVKKNIADSNAEVIVAPPFTALVKVADFCKNSLIKIAGQNLYWENTGAFTGEISGMMLKDAGASHVIIGHSERRQYFGETDLDVNKKVQAALNNQLIPIVCVGETLAEREANEIEDVIFEQVTIGLDKVDLKVAATVVVAYEPVWAIGTGKTATPEQAQEVHAMIREMLGRKFSLDIAAKMRILYGGSVKPSNSKELLALPDVDGALIGGASLKAEDFITIIKNI